MVKACVAIGLWGLATAGFLFAHAGVPVRLLAFVAGASLMLALPLTDEIGFALGGAVVAYQWWRGRSARRLERHA